MCLNFNSEDTTSEKLEIEVMCIMANHMECHCLLVEKVLDMVQDGVYCLAGFTYSQQITEQAQATMPKKTFEEMVPKHYRDFAKVFSKDESQGLPEHQPWDHAIDLEPDAVMHWKVKMYPMSPNKQVELDKFLDKHIKKGLLECEL